MSDHHSGANYAEEYKRSGVSGRKSQLLVQATAIDTFNNKIKQ